LLLALRAKHFVIFPISGPATMPETYVALFSDRPTCIH
jgi:hypothetical protein